MADRIEEIIDAILEREGGYVLDEADRGGETNYGITVAVARANGYSGKMRDMPAEFARKVYRRRYIDGPGFDLLLEVSPDVAAEVIDTGVNMGPSTAATMLQRALNAFNDGRYDELFVDGRCGALTAGALRDYLAWRGDEGRRALLAVLNGVQSERYLGITERDPRQRRFFYGWIRERVLNQLP